MPDSAEAGTGQHFTTSSPSLRFLIESIKNGTLGLPDLQRAFVWKNVQVRDLFDSLYRGFPVGVLLTWKTGADGNLRVIGTRTEQKAPQAAIVDGQQRLTSLFAVIEGREVERAGHRREVIKIAFNPLTSEFKVIDAAVKNDPEFIPDIASLMAVNANIMAAARAWLTKLSQARQVTEEEIDRGEKAIARLAMLPSYLFTLFELPASMSPAVVSDIFVRINSKGKKLNQADFLLTMMSVYWDEGRKELEAFCEKAARGDEAPANPYLDPSPDQLLRVTVGLGFSRAKLAAMHAVLRGHTAFDSGNEPVGQTAINDQFAKMAEAQASVLDLNHWTGFQKCLLAAGYRDYRLISSQISIIATYLHWLIGKSMFGLSEAELRQPIACWFFMAALTGRYTASMESQLERELRILDELPKTKEAWVAAMARDCAAVLTPDFWHVTLPGKLATSAATGPTKFAFYAAQNLLGAKALYSDLPISQLLDPAYTGTRAALESHHVFPKGYLKDQGVHERERNQIANYTLAEWLDNADIAKKAPSDYAPPMAAKLSGPDLAEMHRNHALPHEWWKLAYPDFLKKRRELMAEVIESAYAKLSGVTTTARQPEAAPPSAEQLIAAGESEIVEYKSTLRKNLHTGSNDEKIELSALKSLAGFLNNAGGTLIIGINDDGEALGLDNDAFPDEDSMQLHLVNIVKQRMGTDVMPFIHPKFEEYQEKKVFSLRCDKGHRAVFVKEGQLERFYVRSGPSTQDLQGSAQHDYIRARFG